MASTGGSLKQHRRDATFEDAEADGDERLHEQVQHAVEHGRARGRPEPRLEDYAGVVAVVRQGIRTFPIAVLERTSGGLCGNIFRASHAIDAMLAP